jgi:hypothetical protein
MEILLKKTHVLKDFAKLAVVIANYALRSLLMTQIPHLQGLWFGKSSR